MIMLPVIADIAQCAPSGLQAPLDRSNAEQLTRVLKALADPSRLQLVALINSQDNREACVCDLADAVKLSQPTVSHHLKVLTDAGLVTRQKRGTWVWYAVCDEQLESLKTVLG